ncbi:hypothetical protein APR11_000380 [Nocardia amikacinitolerans]|uniref:hypothetical protein n=1 Tax=Nocardia amikacinitolerans TaxID=756689 RepID=UPI0020A3C2C2|nr:hypothetical protein [Nocardia amikacinitolerans]MCP2293976.1 hypothetical protein [Nocardia amikacinitolerans]
MVIRTETSRNQETGSYPYNAPEEVKNMATKFKRAVVTIPSGTGRRSFRASVDFPSNVREADVALNGFRLNFAGVVQRPIGEVEVDLELVSVVNRRVFFDVHCQYADANFDDPYNGYASVLVIADAA